MYRTLWLFPNASDRCVACLRTALQVDFTGLLALPRDVFSPPTARVATADPVTCPYFLLLSALSHGCEGHPRTTGAFGSMRVVAAGGSLFVSISGVLDRSHEAPSIPCDALLLCRDGL